MKSMYARITEKCTPQNGCWVWHGAMDRDGYGLMCVNGRGQVAHRASYEYFVGAIPDGLQIDHLCRNPSCVNPKHLEPVTPKENAYRSTVVQYWDKRRAQTHCKHGHSLADCYVGYKGRQCKTCTKIREKARRTAA